MMQPRMFSRGLRSTGAFPKYSHRLSGDNPLILTLPWVAESTRQPRVVRHMPFGQSNKNHIEMEQCVLSHYNSATGECDERREVAGVVEDGAVGQWLIVKLALKP